MDLHNVKFAEAARVSHDAASAGVKDIMPHIKANDIISLVLACAGGKKKPADAAKELALKYKEPAQKYVRIFCETFAAETIDRYLKESKDSAVVSLSEEGFSHTLIDSSENIAAVVRKYTRKEIDDSALIQTLYKQGIAAVGIPVLKAKGFDTDSLVKSGTEAIKILSGIFSGQNPDVASFISKTPSLAPVPKAVKATAAAPSMVPNVPSTSLCAGELPVGLSCFEYLAGSMTAYSAFTEVYRLLQEALNQASISYDQRVLAEEISRQNIERIRTCREEMDRIVSQYLGRHISAFQSGFRKMDQAILDRDSNGYLRGSTEIQEALGYDVQFRNQDDFDALMDSDDAFHL